MLCTEISTSLGSLQKFEGAPGEFKGALGSWQPLILSPEDDMYVGNLVIYSLFTHSIKCGPLFFRQYCFLVGEVEGSGDAEVPGVHMFPW